MFLVLRDTKMIGEKSLTDVLPKDPLSGCKRHCASALTLCRHNPLVYRQNWQVARSGPHQQATPARHSKQHPGHAFRLPRCSWCWS